MAVWNVLLWAYVWVFSLYCLVVLICASRRRIEPRSPETPLSVGMVVPAYNEAAHVEFITQAVATAQAIGAPIVIVDDGSTDGSGAVLESLCRAGDALLIRHEVNRGKAAALNSGIAALQTDLILTLDADTTVDGADIAAAMARFLEVGIGAVALTIDGAGHSQTARAQAIEYRYALDFERVALAQLGIVFTVPGSASIWRRRALVQIGGFKRRTCAEDTDATISLSLAGWKIDVAPAVTAVTECPHSIADLLQQRARWIWGTIQAAGFALVHLSAGRKSGYRLPATVFIAVTALNIFGYLLGIGLLYRLLTMELGRSDVYAGCVLVAVTLIRLGLVHRMRGCAGENILRVLMLLIAMQIVNTVAYWYGLASGRATKISW
jgi:cellulose synthase/poly-beta-1,6-N-acetylglucosamine synthase-like glycosyltransferase